MLFKIVFNVFYVTNKPTSENHFRPFILKVLVTVYPFKVNMGNRSMPLLTELAPKKHRMDFPRNAFGRDVGPFFPRYCCVNSSA